MLTMIRTFSKMSGGAVISNHGPKLKIVHVFWYPYRCSWSSNYSKNKKAKNLAVIIFSLAMNFKNDFLIIIYNDMYSHIGIIIS